MVPTCCDDIILISMIITNNIMKILMVPMRNPLKFVRIFAHKFNNNKKSNWTLHSQNQNTTILSNTVLYRESIDKMLSEYVRIIDFANEFNFLWSNRNQIQFDDF